MIRALLSIAGLLLAVLVVLFLINLAAPGAPLQLTKGFFGFVASLLAPRCTVKGKGLSL